MANRNQWTADRRLYLDKDGHVVEANDPARARLLVAAGNTISLDEAERLGLTEAKARQGPAENKLRQGPSENKVPEVVPGVPALDMETGEVQGIEEETEGVPGESVQEDGQSLPPAAEADVKSAPAPDFEAAASEPEPVRRGRRKE